MSEGRLFPSGERSWAIKSANSLQICLQERGLCYYRCCREAVFGVSFPVPCLSGCLPSGGFRLQPWGKPLGAELELVQLLML